MLHSFSVFSTGGNNINPRCVYTAVTEDVGKFCNVFFDSVKGTGKQMAKIMREHFLWINLRLRTKIFHFPPNVGTANRLSCSRDKNCTRLDSLLCCIAEQFFSQFFYNKYRACFSLKRNNRFAVFLLLQL